jgi:hypothetical protein
MSEKTLAVSEPIDVGYRVQVAYSAPLEVIVDPRRGTVERVVVIDEAVALDPAEGARQESTLHPIPSPVAKRAIEIAEAGEWPGWEHGF